MSDEYVVLDGWRATREHRFENGARRGEISALTVQGPRPQAVIPYSLIGPDSEVFHLGDRGALQIERWKAEELGLAAEGGRRPLPKKGERDAAVVRAVVTIIRGQARMLRDTRAPSDAAGLAICDCGEASPEHDADPIGWHQAEACARVLERLAKRIEDVT